MVDCSADCRKVYPASKRLGRDDTEVSVHGTEKEDVASREGEKYEEDVLQLVNQSNGRQFGHVLYMVIFWVTKKYF